jgi:hypothetical protein
MQFAWFCVWQVIGFQSTCDSNYSGSKFLPITQDLFIFLSSSLKIHQLYDADSETLGTELAKQKI